METFAPKGSIYGPILPLFVLERPITLGAKIMYALLCNYASEKDHCWPSHATLAARLSCSVSSVKNYLRELVNEKLIDVRREQYRSSVYYMLRPVAVEGLEANVDRAESKVALPESNSGYLNNLSIQSKENPPLPPLESRTPNVSATPDVKAPAAGGVSVSDFEIAWELYPKKEAKGFARIAWLKLQRNGQLPALDEIRGAIRHFAASESWQREQGRFVPQMGNWLRGQRWLDPLPPAESEILQRNNEMHRAMQAQEEQEKRLEEQRKKEKARLQPIFDAFVAKFGMPLNGAMDAMAFGTWMYLHSKGIAPVASDVPPGNVQEIIDFLNSFRRNHAEAQYLMRNVRPEVERLDTHVAGLKSSDETPLFARLFSRTAELRQAV